MHPNDDDNDDYRSHRVFFHRVFFFLLEHKHGNCWGINRAIGNGIDRKKGRVRKGERDKKKLCNKYKMLHFPILHTFLCLVVFQSVPLGLLRCNWNSC